VTVELKNDLAITGVLHSVDQYLNIKLTSTRVVDEAKYPHMVRWAWMLPLQAISQERAGAGHGKSRAGGVPGHCQGSNGKGGRAAHQPKKQLLTRVSGMRSVAASALAAQPMPVCTPLPRSRPRRCRCATASSGAPSCAMFT
jgi:small nuclear ribonucleoprotein (snRNP)-like protein